MFGRSAFWFPLTLLALLAILTFWIDKSVQPPQPKLDGSSRHEPDYQVNNFTTTKTGPDGKPRYTLSATEMRHYPDNDSTELERPRFTMYGKLKADTQIQGQRGTVSSGGDDIDIMDDVKFVRSATREKGELTLWTEFLHIRPSDETATTDKPVKIVQAPHTVIYANGMDFEKKDRLLTLTKRVNVHYEKPGSRKITPAPLPAKALPASINQTNITPKLTAKTSKPKSAKSTSQRRIRRHYEKPAT